MKINSLKINKFINLYMKFLLVLFYFSQLLDDKFKFNMEHIKYIYLHSN